MTDTTKQQAQQPQQAQQQQAQHLITSEAVAESVQAHKDLQDLVAKKKYYNSNENLFDTTATHPETSFQEVKDRVLDAFIEEFKTIYKAEHALNTPTLANFIDPVTDLVQSGRGIPAGSILSCWGTDKKSSLSNCYLTPIEHDSIEDIFEAQKRLARTYSYRGGSGTDITVLRPKGAYVNNAASSSSGSVSFMPLTSEVTNVIGTNGRRAALLISEDIRHPDAMDFIWCKSKPEEIFGKDPLTGKVPDVTGANITIKLTDEFMEKVAADEDWTFSFPNIDKVTMEVHDNFAYAPIEVLRALGCATGDILQTEQGDRYEVIWVEWEDSKIALRKCTEPVVPDNAIPALGEAPRQYAEITIGEAEHFEGEDIEEISLGVSNVYYFPYDTRLHRAQDKPTTQVYENLWTGDYDVWECDYQQICKKYHTLPAKQIFEELAESAHISGDPGVAFIDTVQRLTPGTYIAPMRLKPTGFNPCGEQSLSAFSNCLLFAMVLHKYVSNPWSSKAEFDYTQFTTDVASAVLYLNTASVSNRDKHPLKQQREEDDFGRRIGIEITGLADALAMLGYEYGSPSAIEITEKIMHAKAVAELQASLDLVPHFGVAPAFTDMLASGKTMQGLLETPYFTSLNLPSELATAIAESRGLANTAWNTVGPCGSISIMSDNCTGGIEPVFSYSYERVTRLADRSYEFIHGPASQYLARVDSEEGGLPEKTAQEWCKELNYIEAGDIDYVERIAIQAMCQKYTDSSISSTINLPEQAPVSAIYDIYFRSWEAGLKGITVFRDGCKDGIFTSTTVKEDNGNDKDSVDDSSGITLQNVPIYSGMTCSDGSTPCQVLIERELLDTEQAVRHCVTWQRSKLYLIVSVDEEERPIEIFAKLPRTAGINGDGQYHEHVYQEKTSHWDTICRLTSILLRVGMPINRIINQLDKSSYSMTDAAGIVSRILRKHLPEIEATDEEIVEQGMGDKCPNCGTYAYVREGGCVVCKACGESTCG